MIYVIEFEGFLVKKSFVFKEICVRSVENNLTTIHFFLRPPFPFDKLSRKDRGIVKYCEENLHGIYWYAGHDQFKETRYYLQDLITSEDIVYTKGNQKVDILKRQLGLRCIIKDIEIEKPEALKFLAEGFKMEEEQKCPLSFHCETVHCAVLKSLLLKNILTDLGNNSTENEQVLTEECSVPETDNEMQWKEVESGHSVSDTRPNTGSQ